MCGIAGLFNVEQTAESRVGYIRRMLASLRHRGPDEMGFYVDDTIVMGTARLSIVDVKAGQQPIADRGGRFWICFNGEIYNYKELKLELIKEGFQFTTDSDTEVLLNAWIAWGDAALTKFNGAFAFCIYDKLRHSIVLARDRFGKRPLFYTQVKTTIVFGSEMKCFLAYEPFKFEFDIDQLASIFRIWTPIDNQSGFKGIAQVPAASYVYADCRTTKLVSYGQLPIVQSRSNLSEEDATYLIRDTLAESVRLRLRSDVEVGAYLSGGVDSAIVTHLMMRHTSRAVKTFSVEFAESEFDESPDQRAISDRLGTDHASVRIGDKEIADHFPAALWHAEVPVFRTAFVPMFLLSGLVNSRGIKVVLTGEGADEAFLGYDLFKETLLRTAWKELSVTERENRLARLYPYLPHFGASNQKILYALFDRLSSEPAADLFSHQLRFHNSQHSTRLLAGKTDGLKALQKLIEHASEPFGSFSAIQKAQWLECKTLLGGYLLSTQGDRMGMAHSVENRCPFLDPAVVAVGARTNLRFDDGFAEKRLLKKAFQDELPTWMFTKPKRPYRAPDASAFLRTQPSYLEAINSPRELQKIDALNTSFCAAFVESIGKKGPQQIGQAENQTYVFLLSIALLHDKFIGRRPKITDDIDALMVKEVDGRIAA